MHTKNTFTLMCLMTLMLIQFSASAKEAPLEEMVLTCQSAIISLDATGVATITATDILSPTSSVTCSGSVNYIVSPNTLGCANIGNNPITLTAFCNGVAISSCTAIVTIVDDLPPDMQCQDIPVYLDATGNAIVKQQHINNGSTDNCDNQLNYSVFTPNYTCAQLGYQITTLFGTDDYGNTEDCVSLLEVIDPNPPTLSCVGSYQVALDATGSVTLLASSLLTTPSTTVCGVPRLSLSQATFDCTDVGVQNLVVVSSNSSGYMTTCNVSLTITDPNNSCCQNILHVNNQPFIQTGEYEANVRVYSDQIVPTGADVEFHAGNHVEMLPGFEVQIMSDFHAYILPCN